MHLASGKNKYYYRYNEYDDKRCKQSNKETSRSQPIIFEKEKNDCDPKKYPCHKHYNFIERRGEEIKYCRQDNE
mgnify:CR=1 FL=1